MFFHFCVGFFILSTIACGVLQWYIRQHDTQNPVVAIDEREFTQFQRVYLVIYCIVMFADWLQGPYVYALYSFYQFTKEDIATLFIAGFASSAVVGTFVGSLADKYGRKRFSVYFGIIYGVSALTKLFPNFWILLIGRILGGIATSLLFSVFEAWMVYEHTNRKFSPESLSRTFSIAIVLGNGVAAILAGVVASIVSTQYGYTAPFMVSLLLLVTSSIAVSILWNENYGDSEMDVKQVFSGGIAAIRKDIRVALLGTIQSLFEGSMYVFVFMWTPMLSKTFPEYDDATLGLHGLTFASFMVMIMLGGSLFRFLERKWNVEQIYLGTLMLSASLFFLVATVDIGMVIFFAFMVFEICCGIHFTCIGTLRGKYIPEESRAAIMNLFRVPLNLLVCLLLRFVDKFSEQAVFGICFVWLAVASYSQSQLTKLKVPVLAEPNLSDWKNTNVALI